MIGKVGFYILNPQKAIKIVKKPSGVSQNVINQLEGIYY